MIKIKRRIWVPVAVWILLFVFIFNIANYFQTIKNALFIAGHETITSLIIYYFTSLVLFPRYYKSGKSYLWVSFIALFGISAVLLILDIQFIDQFRDADPDRPPAFFHFMRYLFSSGFVYFVATSISLMEQTTQLQEAEKILTKEKLETELKLLKAQINPHFIFNALNNIYSLTYMKSKNAPDSVLKLSEMLRYVFYDCNKDRVPLAEELKYIENFTAFQQMKSEYPQKINLTTAVNGGSIEIAPMLFIPFIENAFKYSRIEENEDAFIDITMNYSKPNLHFTIKNSVAQNKANSGSGMGIKNVQHRLDIIYPEQHKLKIDEQEIFYKIDLTLEV